MAGGLLGSGKRVRRRHAPGDFCLVPSYQEQNLSPDRCSGCGGKTEPEVQESIRRWWELIHPADRPIAQKYLQLVLERSTLALEAIEEGLMEASQNDPIRSPEASKVLKVVGRVVKQAPLSSPPI